LFKLQASDVAFEVFELALQLLSLRVSRKIALAFHGCWSLRAK
jgi:hypothetical protein